MLKTFSQAIHNDDDEKGEQEENWAQIYWVINACVKLAEKMTILSDVLWQIGMSEARDYYVFRVRN